MMKRTRSRSEASQAETGSLLLLLLLLQGYDLSVRTLTICSKGLRIEVQYWTGLESLDHWITGLDIQVVCMNRQRYFLL